MEKTTKKMGRPPKDPENKASKTITIKLTQAEFDELRHRVGDGLRTWIRETALRAARRLR